MTAPQLPCVCGCPQGRHLMGRRDCRSCQTCSEYEPATEAEVVAFDVAALLGEVQADVTREAALERERDEWRERAGRLETLAVDRLAATVKAQRRVAELETLLEHAEQYARDLQDEGVVPAGTVVVLFAYDAWQCLGGSVNCSRRYFADDPDHGCGPLTPVTVTVSRRPA